MNLYALVCDDGDGSSSISWFTCFERARSLIMHEDDYRCNDSVRLIILPEGTDLTTLGVSIDTSEEVIVEGCEEDDD